MRVERVIREMLDEVKVERFNTTNSIAASSFSGIIDALEWVLGESNILGEWYEGRDRDN